MATRPAVAVDGVEAELAERFPKSMNKKAHLLVEKLKADLAIAWTNRGEFLRDGVVDLVGWEPFLASSETTHRTIRAGR